MKENNSDRRLIMFQFNSDIVGFGLSSYMDILIEQILQKDFYKITVIHVDAQSCTEVNVLRTESIDKIYIPTPVNGLTMETGEPYLATVYAKRILQLIYPHLSEEDNYIFLLNSMVEVYFLPYLRDYFNCKIVWVLHSLAWKDLYNVPDIIFKNEWLYEKQKFSKELVESTETQKKLAISADVVITVTHHAKRFLQDMFKISSDKITVIHNSVKPPMDPNRDISQIREELGIKKGERVILYCGRLARKKGIFILINAFKNILDSFPNVKLVMIGDGLLRDAIRASKPAQGAFIFTGQLNDLEKTRWYQIAEIGILPSLAEQCSLAALEMRSWKIPLIVSNVDGNDELFTHEYDCLKIPHAVDETGEKMIEPDVLETAIKDLLTNKAQRRRLANNSFKIVNQKFNIDIFVEEYFKVFNFLLTNAKN